MKIEEEKSRVCRSSLSVDRVSFFSLSLLSRYNIHTLFLSPRPPLASRARAAFPFQEKGDLARMMMMTRDDGLNAHCV